MDTPSASDASRTKARTSSLHAKSRDSWSSEKRATADAFIEAGNCTKLRFSLLRCRVEDLVRRTFAGAYGAFHQSVHSEYSLLAQ
jgi:hypothetical protein